MAWQRERIVGSSASARLVVRMIRQSVGGSSSVFSSVLAASSPILSAWEMMKTRLRPSKVLMALSRRIARMLLILMMVARGIETRR